MQLWNHFKLGLEQAGHLAGLGLERGRQHVGEELHSDGQQELHEGHHHKDQEGHETEEVSADAEELDGQRAKGEQGARFSQQQESGGGPSRGADRTLQAPRGPNHAVSGKLGAGAPLAGQWLGLLAPTAGGTGQIPGWGSVCHPCCVEYGQKSLKREKKSWVGANSMRSGTRHWQLLHSGWPRAPAVAPRPGGELDKTMP